MTHFFRFLEIISFILHHFYPTGMSYNIEIMGENQLHCLSYFIMEISGEFNIKKIETITFACSF